MTNTTLSPEVEKKINNIIAESEGISTTEVSPADQSKFSGGFSLGALVFGVFYFVLMKDRLYIILSIIFSLLFPPTPDCPGIKRSTKSMGIKKVDKL